MRGTGEVRSDLTVIITSLSRTSGEQHPTKTTNPHEPGTALSIPRVLSLEAFGRRPTPGQRVERRRHPKPSQ
jgi:hypothetical protein